MERALPLDDTLQNANVSEVQEGDGLMLKTINSQRDILYIVLMSGRDMFVATNTCTID